MYNIDTTIQSNSRFIIPTDVIAGYVPISCFYHGGTGENVVYPTCPRNRATDGTHYIALINTYEQSIYTKGNLFVYYIRQIDVG